MVFVKAQDLIPSDIGLRSLNKLKSAHGGLYMGVHIHMTYASMTRL